MTKVNQDSAEVQESTMMQPMLGMRITALRILRDLSYEDMADLTGVTVQTVKKWERTWQSPDDTSHRRLKAIADALDLDVRAITQEDPRGFMIMMQVAKTTRFGKTKMK